MPGCGPRQSGVNMQVLSFLVILSLQWEACNEKDELAVYDTAMTGHKWCPGDEARFSQVNYSWDKI